VQSDDEPAGTDVRSRKISRPHILTQSSPHKLDQESVVS
jgi:hypothetical protein